MSLTGGYTEKREYTTLHVVVQYESDMGQIREAKSCAQQLQLPEQANLNHTFTLIKRNTYTKDYVLFLHCRYERY